MEAGNSLIQADFSPEKTKMQKMQKNECENAVLTLTLSTL